MSDHKPHLGVDIGSTPDFSVDREGNRIPRYKTDAEVEDAMIEAAYNAGIRPSVCDELMVGMGLDPRAAINRFIDRSIAKYEAISHGAKTACDIEMLNNYGKHTVEFYESLRPLPATTRAQRGMGTPAAEVMKSIAEQMREKLRAAGIDAEISFIDPTTKPS